MFSLAFIAQFNFSLRASSFFLKVFCPYSDQNINLLLKWQVKFGQILTEIKDRIICSNPITTAPMYPLTAPLWLRLIKYIVVEC